MVNLARAGDPRSVNSPRATLQYPLRVAPHVAAGLSRRKAQGVWRALRKLIRRLTRWRCKHEWIDSPSRGDWVCIHCGLREALTGENAQTVRLSDLPPEER